MSLSQLSHDPVASASLRRRSRALSALSLCAALLLTAVAPRAMADAGDDDPEVVAQAKEHYKAGLEAYKAGKFDVAIRELKKAYLLKRLPPLLLNIGATYRKTGDLDLSLHFYQKYLDEAPSDAKDRPEVEKIIAEIKTQKTEAPAEDVAPKRNDDVAPARHDNGGGATEWKHDVIDAVPPETPIDVRVQTPVMKGVKIFVYYRTAGQSNYASVLMKRHNRKEKVGRIPADAVTGRSLQYYIEAKDSAGTVVKSSGDQSNPNIVMIEDGVKPVMIAGAGREAAEEQVDEDAPKKSKKSNRELDDEEAPPTTGAVALREDAARNRNRKKSGGGMSTLGKVGVGLLAGGAGVAVVGGVFLGLAHHEASVVSDDSKLGTVGGSNVYFNNDPNAPGGVQDSTHQSRGKLYNGVGIGLLTSGLIVAGAGAACMIADAVTKNDRNSHPKKKRKHRRVEEEEEEETRNWYVAPSVGPGAAMVSGGFSF